MDVKTLKVISLIVVQSDYIRYLLEVNRPITEKLDFAVCVETRVMGLNCTHSKNV